MIAEMTHVLILGRKRDNLEVVRALQDAGVVQIEPMTGDTLPRGVLAGAEAERRALLERQLARSESILAAGGGQAAEPAHTRLKTIGELEPYLEDVGHRADILVKERSELEAELGAVNAYRAPVRAAAELAGTLGRSGRVAALAATLAGPEDLTRLVAALDEALPGRYALGTRAAGVTTAAVIAVRAADAAAARSALARAGVGELRPPGRFAGLALPDAARLLEERARTAPEELAGIREGIERLARDHAATVAAARLELRDEVARYAALEAAAQGRYGFALQGWLPADRKPALDAALRPMEGQVVCQYERVDPHHAERVPVKLENNAFVRPFELLMGIFAPPGYGTFDPTWVLAVFFPVFFGFVIGDIGFGLISLAVALGLRGMATGGRTLDLAVFGVSIPPDPLRKVATILTHMSFWSIVWGFIYGELFGTLGEHLGWFYVPGEVEAGEAVSGLPVLLYRVSTEYTNTMLFLALVPGIAQILYGWYVRFRLGLAHNDRRHTYEGLGMFVGLVGVIVYAYKFRNPGAPELLVPIAVICLAVFLVCVFLAGVPMMLVELLSNGGNILSYLRLYAVGLSGALLANLATDLGWDLGKSLGVIGLLVGIVIASFIHLVVIALTIIGHVLQPLRLHYAEFFTKFGFFDKSGRPYRPFARSGGLPAGR